MMLQWNAMLNRGKVTFKGRISYWFLPFFFLWGCNTSETKSNTPAAEEKLESTQDSIQRNFVNRSCVSCHTEATASNRHVSLTDISKVIEKPGHDHSGGAHIRYLIKPGCPKQSFFLSIIREGKMPPREKIASDIIKTIEDFIISLNPQAQSGKLCDDDEPGGDDPFEE